MMILRSSPASPFGRKVKIAMNLLGLASRVRIDVADTLDPEDSIRQQNPLGKIPALVLEDGRVIYDSRVICEYFDHLAGGGKIIPAGDKRFDALTLQALADGIMDAAILKIYEIRFRDPATHNAKWVSHQDGKIQRALAALNSAPPAIGALPNIGAITLACALGYLDLRFEGGWRSDYPRLVPWLENFAKQFPIFEETRFKG